MTHNLFNDPALELAKKALTPEQREEYENIGKYMYNNPVYASVESGSKIKPPKSEDLVAYALEGIKSGGDPKDLSDEELQAIIQVYGDKWYEKYGISEDDVRKPVLEILSKPPEMNDNDIQERIKKLPRQERRRIEREMMKNKGRLEAAEKRIKEAKIRNQKKGEKGSPSKSNIEK